MNDVIERPEALRSMTYKIKVPTSQYAVYITISDMVYNEGEESEYYMPWEIFLSSKNMSAFMWITALMRTISFIFRYTPEKIVDLVEELKSVADPTDQGCYCKKGYQGLMPSLVADIAHQIESHLKTIGVIK